MDADFASLALSSSRHQQTRGDLERGKMETLSDLTLLSEFEGTRVPGELHLLGSGPVRVC